MFGHRACLFILLGIIYQFKYISCNSGNRMSKICDSKEFYDPYVKILRRRAGPPVFKLQSAGFVDLRNQFGVLLCINGPAYLYTEMEEQYNVSSKVPTLSVFGNMNGTDVKFFTHECFLINRRVQANENQKPGVDNTGVDSEARESFHNVGTPPSDSDKLNPKMEVHGIRAYGVTLLGAKGNYRNASMYMFIHPAFGHNDQLLVINSSFVTIGRNAWKAHDKYTNSSVTIKPSAKTDDELCSRPQGPDPFDAVFRRCHNRDDYNWTIIPLKDSEKLQPIPPTSSTTPGPPTKPPKSNISAIERIGRIIDPALLGQGFAPSSHPEGGHSAPGDRSGGALDINGNPIDKGNNSYPCEFPEDYDETKPKPYRRYLKEISVCQAMPNQTSHCENKTVDKEQSCKVLKSVLGLNPPPPPKDPAKNETFEWKKEILTIIEDTFAKLCPLINKQAVAAVGSIFYTTYIEAVHAANATLPTERDARWSNLLREMTHCQTQATPLEFTEVAGQPDEDLLAPAVLPLYYIATDENGTAVTPGNITEEISTTPAPDDEGSTVKQRSLTVKRYDGSQGPLFHYEEAAEADFEFNVAIDFQWKMFSTVIGYCNKLYKSKKSSVFPIILSLFIDDFLNLEPKNWVDANSNHVFSFFMGDRNVWLDECMEGAYVHSDAEEYRPVRPININDGQHLNHFTRTPPHT